MKKILNLIATFFNLGHAPLAPGTWTSLVVVITLYILNPYLNLSIYAQIGGILIVFLIGIPAANQAEIKYKTKDPRPCVIDEVAGQMTTLILIPHSLINYMGAFLLFRFFDIAKPFPIRRIEKIPGGPGIMLDDIMAGLYSLGVLHLILWLV